MNYYELLRQWLKDRRNAALAALVKVYLSDGMDYQNGAYYFLATIGNSTPEWVRQGSERAIQVYKLYSDYIDAKERIVAGYDDAKEKLPERWERACDIVSQVARTVAA